MPREKGKIVRIADNVKDYVMKFVIEQTSIIGLIIGKATPEEDHVVRLTRCIDKESQVDLALDHFFSIEGDWLGGMAAELSHMLPGGLDVIGIFAITTPRREVPLLLKQLVHQSSAVVYGTRDKVLKDVGFHPRHPAWLAVHFNVKDGACLLSKYYDLGKGSRSGLVTWDYKNTLTQWCVFSTYFRLEDALVGEESSDLYKLLTNYMKEGSLRIFNSTVMLDSKIPDSKVEVNKIKNLKTLPGIISKSGNCKAYCICSTDAPTSTTLIYKKPEFTVDIAGGIFSCVYLPVNSMFGEAVEALKRDAILNLNYRCLLTAEFMSEQSSEVGPETTLVLPRRIALKQDEELDPFMYFDYAFADESVESVRERFQDAFDLPVTSDMIVTNLESLPSFLGITEKEREDEEEEFLDVEDEEVAEETEDNNKAKEPQISDLRKTEKKSEVKTEGTKIRERSKKQTRGPVVVKEDNQLADTDLANPLNRRNLAAGAAAFVGMGLSFGILAAGLNYVFDVFGELPSLWFPFYSLFSSGGGSSE